MPHESSTSASPKISLTLLGALGGVALASAALSLANQWQQLDDFRPVLAIVVALVGLLAGAAAGWQAPALLAARGTGSAATTAAAPSADRPYVLDTSVIIDGRIADVVETRIIDNPLVVPACVLQELQGIADSSDRLRRARGRRGLDVLNRLRNGSGSELRIDDRELPGFENQPVDQKLVLLARHLGGKVVTGDYNLNKVARLHDVEVINLNDLAQALRPAVLPGETLDVLVVKAGEEPGQGVGYLEDGTMIVVEQGRDKINETVRITVTSVLQTSAGRMIFGRT